MIEKFFRTQEVAKICQVAQGTVIRWIKDGQLPASFTVGGHHRIHSKNLLGLLENLHLPIPPELSLDQSLKILIVDDEPEICRVIRWTLEKDFPGVLVEEAQEGFVAGLKTHSFRPHLVMLDLMLPGMDGFGVCQFVRQFPELKDIRIIAMSGLMTPEAEKKIRELGADDVLEKPFDHEALKSRIHSQLNLAVKG
ncbi:MAG: response regulator [Candidatus Omnitrophica bacterium]|nr:response regulator [Candidatus Omnitrophota bacterium]